MIQRRAGAQPQEHRPRAAPRPAHRLHRAVRFGQVVAGLRHHLRRGPAPLRRVAVRVRPPVPGPDGQAGRRLHRGSVAGDLDRPEVGVSRNPRSTVGHHHRDLRLPAPALRPHRRSPHCPETGEVLEPPDAAADRRPGARAARGHPLPGARAGGAGSQGRVRHAARRAGRRGLHPGPGRRRESTSTLAGTGGLGGEGCAWPATSSTPSRWSSTGWCAARASSAGSPTRWRPLCASPRGTARSRSSPATTTSASRAAGCSLRAGLRPRAPQLLVQLPLRRVPRVRRSRHPLPGRPRAGGPRPRRARLADGCDRAVVGVRGEYFQRVLAAVGEEYGFSTGTPWKKLTKAQQKVVLHGRAASSVLVRVPEPLRPHALVQRPATRA